MDLSNNFKNSEKIKYDTLFLTPKINIFFYFKLSFSKFARDSQITQNSNTHKI